MPRSPDSTPLAHSSSLPAATGPLELLRVRFAAVPDIRSAGHVLHSIDEVLIIALCSMLSDNDAFTDMEQFARSQMPWLRTFLPMPHGPPSHDVFRNVFMAIKPQALLLIMADWCGDLSSLQIMIDGKALRGTATATREGMVHVLRAWVHHAGLSAGHAVCSEKSNELNALPQLLAMLELKGTLVSIDAMGTHPDIAAQIHEAGGDYLLALKANQKTTLQAVTAHFAQQDAAAGYTAEAATCGLHPGNVPGPGPLAPGHSVILSHGRYEQRLCTVLGDLDFFHKSWKWAGLQSIIRIIRTTHRGGKGGNKSGEPTVEIHYYLSSLPPDAEVLAARIRAHWSVESAHHVLDVTFGEDHCQVRDRTAAHNLCLLRETSSKVLRDHLPKKSIRSKRKRAALDPDFRTDLLASISHNFRA
jgi:predicted transposase YbfD/YdcC